MILASPNPFIQLVSEEAYQICLNDYIRYVLPFQNANYERQATVTIYIPTSNLIQKDNVDILRWYGKRAKLYSLFQELYSWYDNSLYYGGKELIDQTRMFLNYILSSDAWKIKSQWVLLSRVHDKIEEMLENDMLQADSISLMNGFLEPNETIDQSTVTVRIGVFDDVPLSMAARIHSCTDIRNSFINMCSLHEDNLRHIGLPTQINCIFRYNSC